MLKLYRSKNSICTQKVLITLAEKGLDYETAEVNLFLNEQYSPDYLKINPKGVVPSLDHDGAIINESTLICEYLEDVFPSVQLVPSDAFLKSQMRLWSKAIDEGIFEATRELSFSAMFREKLKNMSEEQRQTRFANVGDPERRARYISTFENGAESHYVLEGIANFEKLFKNMDKALAGGNDWLLGDDYSLADINVIPYVARLHFLSFLDIWTDDRPNIQAWFERAQLRPSYAVAIGEALGADEVADMHTYGSKIKDQVRARLAEYRG